MSLYYLDQLICPRTKNFLIYLSLQCKFRFGDISIRFIPPHSKISFQTILMHSESIRKTIWISFDDKLLTVKTTLLEIINWKRLDSIDPIENDKEIRFLKGNLIRLISLQSEVSILIFPTSNSFRLKSRIKPKWIGIEWKWFLANFHQRRFKTFRNSSDLLRLNSDQSCAVTRNSSSRFFT